MAESGNKTDRLNVGISVLRIWMIFEVMIIHFAFEWCQTNAEGSFFVCFLNRYEYVGVPIFVLLAFILTDYKGMAEDKAKFGRRMYRLIVPDVFWAILYFVILSVLGIVYHEQIVHGISDLFWQILFGHVYNRTLWFQTVLILTTLLVVGLFRLFKDKALIILFFISMLSLFLQYSGINDVMFDLIPWPDRILGGYFSGDYIMYTLGRGIELLPYVFLGAMAGRAGIFERLDKYKMYVLTVSASIIVLSFLVQMFVIPSGFMYGGLGNMVLAVSTLMIFRYLPFDKLPVAIKRGINTLAGYTMAVYFMHQLIKWIYTLVFHFPVFEIFHPLLGCLIIYLTCVAIAWIAGKINVRFIRESFM